MGKAGYLNRVCDKELKFSLEASGAVLIEGAKWCGKTSTAQNAANSALYMQDPDTGPGNLLLAETQPSLLLKGDNPRLIDEWQMAPVLWDAVRFEVDRRAEKGLFILTGSAVPSDNVTAHTGTGRISRIRMRPMSLFESKESNGKVSLMQLFNEEHDIAEKSNLTIKDIAFAICRGGWPASIGLNEKQALKVAIDYVEAVINYDISEVDQVQKGPERVRLLMRSFARNITTMANFQTIKDDIEAQGSTLSDKTIAQYIDALQRIFVVEDLQAWSPSLRSKTAIRTSPKRHFVDPSLAVAVMRTNPDGLLKDFQYFGLLFESLCARDMRVYAQTNDGSVLHYRDKNELEADLIIRLNDGRWGAVEVKLGQKQIEEAAQNLLTLKDKVNKKTMSSPSFLMVVTGGEYAYRRKDGVLVVPIGCLKD
ncbi:MAG: DUF4143 domain-containing protein [Chitinophagales bacterium]|nr:DUF4143 domain-containing protein [Chitinophagales bacterium]